MRLEEILLILMITLIKPFNLFFGYYSNHYLNNLDLVFSDLLEIYKVRIETPINRSNN